MLFVARKVRRVSWPSQASATFALRRAVICAPKGRNVAGCRDKLVDGHGSKLPGAPSLLADPAAGGVGPFQGFIWRPEFVRIGRRLHLGDKLYNGYCYKGPSKDRAKNLLEINRLKGGPVKPGVGI